MPTITVLPLGQSLSTEPGTSVLDALRSAGVEIESPCNGEGICGRCGVWVADPTQVPETPHKNISRQHAEQGLRLACRLIPATDLTLRLPEDFSLNARILEGERISSARVAPAARVEQQEGRYVLHYRGEPETVLDEWDETWAPKGLAVDIGTTTLVLSLVCLTAGEELGTASRLNPQSRFGHDVLSRIQKASSPEGLRELTDAVRGALNQLLEKACAASGSDPREVIDVVVGGNTTMLQLAAGIDPEPLGHLPFTVGIRSGTTHPVSRFGLAVNSRARVYVPPVAHAYVGSDISAGLLSCRDFFEPNESILFVDIGTNGEMGVSADGRWVVASAAAGPAFEAMGLSSGMRAATGAVEAVHTDGNSLEIRTIDGVPPKGICGSGIIDLVATLVRLRVVDSSGRLRRRSEGEGLSDPVLFRLDELDGKAAFRLGEGIYFTQDDVRQLQLAKSAIRTGIDMLLEETGIQAEDLGRLVLAGAFGYHLKPENLEVIGLLPAGMARKVTFAGNTSRTGAAQLLLDGSLRRYLEERMERVQHLTLATGLAFQDRFVENLGFPDPGSTRPGPAIAATAGEGRAGAR